MRWSGQTQRRGSLLAPEDFELEELKRLGLSGNWYGEEQHTSFASGPSVPVRSGSMAKKKPPPPPRRVIIFRRPDGFDEEIVALLDEHGNIEMAAGYLYQKYNEQGLNINQAKTEVSRVYWKRKRGEL